MDPWASAGVCCSTSPSPGCSSTRSSSRARACWSASWRRSTTRRTPACGPSSPPRRAHRPDGRSRSSSPSPPADAEAASTDCATGRGHLRPRGSPPRSTDLRRCGRSASVASTSPASLRDASRRSPVSPQRREPRPSSAWARSGGWPTSSPSRPRSRPQPSTTSSTRLIWSSVSWWEGRPARRSVSGCGPSATSTPPPWCCGTRSSGSARPPRNRASTCATSSSTSSRSRSSTPPSPRWPPSSSRRRTIATRCSWPATAPSDGSCPRSSRPWPSVAPRPGGPCSTPSPFSVAKRRSVPAPRGTTPPARWSLARGCAFCRTSRRASTTAPTPCAPSNACGRRCAEGRCSSRGAAAGPTHAVSSCRAPSGRRPETRCAAPSAARPTPASSSAPWPTGSTPPPGGPPRDLPTTRR